MDQFNAQYHLPGLFEFYALYRLFLPLFFEHREYFYDWCGIGSIYGAPEGCLWGGGRVGCGDCDPRDALALLRDYGISARLTFSNSLLRPEHLADPRCNALCRLFESSGENGIIVHSDLLVDHLRQHSLHRNSTFAFSCGERARSCSSAGFRRKSGTTYRNSGRASS